MLGIAEREGVVHRLPCMHKFDNAKEGRDVKRTQ